MARALEDRPRVASILLFMADQAPAHLTATQGQALGEEALALYRELGDRRGTAVALITLGLTCSTEDARRSRAFYEEGVAALRELGSSRALAWACFHLSSACYSVGDYEPASEVGRECLALFEQFAEPMGIAACHARQGEIALAQGDLAGARRHFEKRREYYLDLGSQPSIAESEIQLADVELAEGNSEAAVARYEHALTLARDANAFGGVVRALTGLGFAALRRGDTRQAGSLFGECLSMDRDWHNPRIVLQCLEGRAGVLILGAAADPAHDPLSTAAAHPDLLWAARILGAAEAVRDRIGPLRPPPEQSRHDAWIATLRTSLRDADFTAAWEAGGALSWEEIMACALGEN